MVLYFTGTGNSRYIASRIAEALNDELFSINDRLKAGDTSPVATVKRSFSSRRPTHGVSHVSYRIGC